MSNIVRKTGRFAGGVGGIFVGTVAGLYTAGKTVVQGGSMEDADEAASEMMDKCIDGGMDVGEDLAPTAVGVISAFFLGAMNKKG